MIFSLENKKKLIKSIIENFEKQSKIFKNGMKRAKINAIEAPGRMQSRYDTAKEEEGALYNALQIRYLILQDSIKEIKGIKLDRCVSVRVGALIRVEIMEEKSQFIFFLIPKSGGDSIKIGNTKITFISIDSPMGKALYKRKKNDIASLILPTNQKVMKILDIG